MTANSSKTTLWPSLKKLIKPTKRNATFGELQLKIDIK